MALFQKNPNFRRRRKGGRGRPGSGGGGDEHAPAHREGTLNQDDLQDPTEREEDAEAERVAHDDNDDDDVDDDDDDNSTNGHDEQEPEYTSRIYNFYLFPDGNKRVPEREVTLNPSTVKFLLENNMDFDKVFREGIPFTTMERAKYMKKKYFERHDKTNVDENVEQKSGTGGGGSSNTPKKNRVKLTRVEDIAFVARTMAGLREWIDSDDSSSQGGMAAAEAANNGNNAANSDNGNMNGTANIPNHPESNGGAAPQTEGTSLVLPPCNAFLRRCLYETIEDEYPGLMLERASSDPAGGVARNQIRAIRLSPVEKKRREDRLRQESWDRLLLQDLGFVTLFEALVDACNGREFSDEQTRKFLDGLSPDLSLPAAHGVEGGTEGRKIPLVIHNGLMDLMFLLTHCHNASLPETLEDTKRTVRGYFPMVYDTKVLATEFSDTVIRSGNSTLGDLFHVVCGDGSPSPRIPLISNQDGRSQGQAHEAAWDAYMTGCVFGALCRRVLELRDTDLTLDGLLHDSSDGRLKEWIGLNKVYMHASLYTIDLESLSGPLAGLHDPLSKGLSLDTTFQVSGITSAVLTKDILQALTEGIMSEEEVIRELTYEIIWVDDQSFFVVTRMSDVVSVEDADAVGLTALHVRNKLRAGLGGNVDVFPLCSYLRNKYGNKTEESASLELGGIVGSLLSATTKPFANALRSYFGKRFNEDEGNSEGSTKRRKLV